MQKYLLLIVFFLTSFATNAQRQLSEYAEVSLLSCENGTEMYNSYGHSAIRVRDPLSDLDLVFNYGTFDDQVPNFVMKFVQGSVDYTLSVSPYEWFIRGYQIENRTVIEQVLNLNLEEKQKFFDRIIINYETDERFYRYDFFYDNCSSRIHEILSEVFGSELSYGDDIDEKSPETFRELIDPYMKHSPWAEFGVGIIMGYPTDNIATNRQKMFLPDHMMARFDMATLHNNPLVKSKAVLFQSTPVEIKNSFFVSPLFILSIFSVIIIAITLFNIKRKKHYFAIDYFLFMLTAIIGALFVFMWLGTRHSPTFANMNMFWAMPLNIIAIFFLKKPIIKPYLLFMLVLNVFGFFLLPQVFHIAVVPIALMMAVRYYKLYRNF